MEQVGLSPELADAAVNDGQREFVDSGDTRLVACRWLSDDRIILVDSEVIQAERKPGPGGMQIEEVAAHAVLDLRPELPAGRLDREMSTEHVLAVVAESFGIPLTCDPDEPISTLYSGPGSEDRVVVHSGCIPPPYWLIGSFDPRKSYCEHVWAFHPDRYRKWAQALDRR